MDILGLFSRRNMLLGMGGAAVATAASAQASGGAGSFPQLLGPAGQGKSGGPLDAAAYDAWSAQVGSRFRAHTGHVLKLVDVQAYSSAGSRPRGVRNQGFVARFDVSRGAALPEGRYYVAPPSGSPFEILLTKGGPDKPLRMLADFN